MSAAPVQVSFYEPKAFLRASGDDVLSFLQGQFTNQLQVSVGSAVYGLWLNQKGKVLADSTVLRGGDAEFCLVSVESLASVIQERLDAYIIADDVVLADETSRMAGLVVLGEGSGVMIQELLKDHPVAGRFVHANGVWAFHGRRAAVENYELVGPSDVINDCARRLVAKGAEVIAGDELTARRIEAGIPAVPTDIGVNDLPNEGALEQVAISYNKGCYLGQEVMARLKNLGQIRRKLHSVRGPGGVPEMGSALYQGAEKVGEVRSATNRGAGFVAMAMLSLVKWKPSIGLSLQPEGKPQVEVFRHG